MELRTACSPQDAKHYDTDRMRKEFLIQDLFSVNKVKYVYSQVRRRPVWQLLRYEHDARDPGRSASGDG